jgi:hypothetical protein
MEVPYPLNFGKYNSIIIINAHILKDGVLEDHGGLDYSAYRGKTFNTIVQGEDQVKFSRNVTLD